MRYFLKEFTEPIAYLIYCIALFAAAGPLAKFRYWLLAAFYAVASLLLFAAIAQNEWDMDNRWNYNVVYLLNICTLSYYYHSICRPGLKRTFIVFLCLVNVLIFAYFNLLQGNFQHNYNAYVYALVFISIVLYAFFYYQDLLLNITEENILRNFDFWLVSSHLFYFLSAFAIILLYATVEDGAHGDIWIIQSFILLISACIALYGYLVAARKKHTP